MPEEWAENLGWSSFQEELIEPVLEAAPGLQNDADLMYAIDIGWFDQSVDTEYRIAAREFVEDWLDQEYGIDFDAYFDWAAWRENYEGEG